MQRFQAIVDGLFRLRDVRGLQPFLSCKLSDLGFDGFCFTSGVKGFGPIVGDGCMTNWPTDKADEYMQNAFYDADPALRHIYSSGTPYLWSIETLSANKRERDFGDFLTGTPVRSGIVIPVSQGVGMFSVLSLSRNYCSPVESNLVPEAVFIASSINLKLTRAEGSEDETLEKISRLSQVQRDILKWVIAGKSSTDIAEICNLSKRNVDYHVAEILKKLEVASRTQAASIYALYARDW